MKKIYIGILAIAALCASSCGDFLDTRAEGDFMTGTYFTNDQQAIDGVDMLYGRLTQENVFGRETMWEQAAANDVVFARTRGYNSLATFEYEGTESPLKDVYNQMYNTMARSNWVIKKLLQKKENEGALTAIETRSLGEAFFIRGFCHLWMAHRYGVDTQGIPFVRYEDFEGEYDNSIPPQRESVMENYQLVIEDFQSALSNLPRFEEYGPEDRGRAHKAAAVGLMVRTYAWWATWDKSKWDNVISLVNELEGTYGRDLAPNFKDVFSPEYADFWNKEYIYSFPSNGTFDGGGIELPGVMLENTGWGLYNGWGQIKPTYDLYEEMAKDNVDGVKNIRLAASMLEYGDNFKFNGKDRVYFSQTDLDVGFQVWKYQQAFEKENMIETGYVSPNPDWPTTRINFPIFRFADALLLRAEAYLVKGDGAKAAADINRIRVRSKLTPLAGNATWADLYHERRCELAFEYSDHLHDLKRWHRTGAAEIKELAAKELNARPRVRFYENRQDPNSPYRVDFYQDYPNKKPYQDYMMVFPYREEEIVKANGALKQNPGYPEYR